MAVTSGDVVGPYRLEQMLGRGGMAIVHRASHRTTGRRVALKRVIPELNGRAHGDRLRREGRMQAVLNHPHVVAVHEIGSGAEPYLAMQLIEGPTLADLVAAWVLGVERSLGLLAQVAEALDALHAAGMVHRDIKPRNILIDEDDHAYLADFGLTQWTDGAVTPGAAAFLGTVAYAAPEVAQGEPASAASDRYAFAAMLFECLTGTVVFPRETPAAALYAHVYEAPPSVTARRSAVPAALDRVVARGLAKNPDDRPATAVEFIASARATLAATDLGAPAPRSWDARRSGALWAASADAPTIGTFDAEPSAA